MTIAVTNFICIKYALSYADETIQDGTEGMVHTLVSATDVGCCFCCIAHAMYLGVPRHRMMLSAYAVL